MFRDELDAALDACPVVYFAYGLCEPHGPQNALGLDALKAHAICVQTAQTHGGVVAPPDYWHIHEMGLSASWLSQTVGEVRQHWMTSAPPWIHFKNVAYHLRVADAIGFHAAIMVTGHYGPNWQDLKTLVNILQPHFAMRLYGLPDFEANQPGFDNDGKRTGDHAGKVETSLLWALEPDCVDVSRLPATGTPGPHFAMGHDAAESSRSEGERMVADEVRWLGVKATELLAEYEKTKPAERRPLSFLDIERIWANDVLPQFREFKTMQYLDRPPPAEDSVWRLNYPIPDLPGVNRPLDR
jgi:creatinine amidohydrolase